MKQAQRLLRLCRIMASTRPPKPTWLPSPQRSIPDALQRGAIEPEEAFLVERFWCELNQVQGVRSGAGPSGRAIRSPMRLVASFIAAILLASCAAHSNVGDYIRSMSAFFWQIANYGHLPHLRCARMLSGFQTYSMSVIVKKFCHQNIYFLSLPTLLSVCLIYQCPHCESNPSIRTCVRRYTIRERQFRLSKYNTNHSVGVDQIYGKS